MARGPRQPQERGGNRNANRSRGRNRSQSRGGRPESSANRSDGRSNSRNRSSSGRSSSSRRAGGGSYQRHGRRPGLDQAPKPVVLSFWARLLQFFRLKSAERRPLAQLSLLQRPEHFEKSYLRDSVIEHLPALFSLFPEMIGKLDWINLRRCEEASVPQSLKKTQHLFGTNRVFIKRESLDVDRIADHEARKLEFLMAPYIQKNSSSKIVAYAFFGSAYSLAISQFCSLFQIRLELHLLRQPLNELRLKRFLEIKRLGVKTLFHSNPASMDSNLKWKEKLLRFFDWKILPFEGQSTLSSLSFVNALLETHAQILHAESPKPSRLFVPLACGSAVVGMTVAKKICGWDDLKIIALGDSSSSDIRAKELAERSNKLLQYLNSFFAKPIVFQFQASDFEVIEHLMIDKMKELEESSEQEYLSRWTARFQDLEGVELEPEQSGAAFFTMVNYLAAQNIEDEIILFWNSFSSVKSDFLNFNLRKASFPRQVLSWKNQEKKIVEKDQRAQVA